MLPPILINKIKKLRPKIGTKLRKQIQVLRGTTLMTVIKNNVPLETLYRAFPVLAYFIRRIRSKVIFTSLDVVWACTIPKSLCLSPQATVFIIALANIKTQ